VMVTGLVFGLVIVATTSPLAPGNSRFVAAGDATAVIPFAQLVAKGSDWSYTGTTPGVIRFLMRTLAKVPRVITRSLPRREP